MKVLRIISDGYHTHIEIDGEMYGEDIKSVVFTHDVNGEHCDGYDRAVLQMTDENGIVFDSRFNKELPEDFNVDKVHTFGEVSNNVIRRASKGLVEDSMWLVDE